MLGAPWLAIKVAAKWHIWSQASCLVDPSRVDDRAALLGRAATDYGHFLVDTAADLVAGLALGGLFLKRHRTCSVGARVRRR